MKTIITLMVLFISVSAFGQLCGDTNGDDFLDISDYVRYIDFFAEDSTFADSTLADSDGRAGITIADLENLEHYMFSEGWFECENHIPYSYSPSLNDTFFIPSNSFICDNEYPVILPVKASFNTNNNYRINALYLAFLTTVEGTSSFISFDSVHIPDFGSNGVLFNKNINVEPDTALVFATRFMGVLYIISDLFELHYTQSSGESNGAIYTEITDRTDMLKYAYSLWGDLYRPVVVNVDYSKFNCGDIDNSGGGINISDLTYLVGYLFSEGVAPPCFNSADVNSDKILGISDVVYVVEYMFNNGPEPVCQ